MKRLFTIIYLLMLPSVIISAQQVMTAEKEVLGYIKIGSGSSEVQYVSSEEGFYSPGAPVVDDKATLWFFPYNKDKILIFVKSLFSEIEYPEYYLKNNGPNTFLTTNQQGEFGYYAGYPSIELITWGRTVGISNPSFINYEIPSGGIVEVKGWNGKEQKQYVLSIEQIPNRHSMTELIKKSFVFRNPEQTRAWLPTQPGGFSIGDDGLLYRNGVLYSAVRPRELDNTDYRYLGRLASGHILWVAGQPGMDKYFAIANSVGIVELYFELPWAQDHTATTTGAYFNYGLGPWGELYCLLAPPAIDPTTWYKPNPAYPAELVVVRNHLKYFGRLNDSSVRMRKGPNTTSDILGTYPIKTGFRILERGTKEETIGGQKNVWYKVRLFDGKEGWFFGAFVHNLYDGPNGLPPPWPNVADW